MNRHQRRRAEAMRRSSAPKRADMIRPVLAALADAGETATGGTLLLSDGEVLHIAADAAHAMAGTMPAGGRA